jgi:basic membrane protein A
MEHRLDKQLIQAKVGKFAAGPKRFGLADKGVDYSIDQYNEKLLPDSVRQRVDELKTEIIAGKIVVPDYYKK